MRLLKFLLRSSWPLFLASILVGAASGSVLGAALMGVINSILEADAAGRSELFFPFVALILFFPASWALAQYLLVLFGERAILKLRMDLSQRILATPLRHIEKVGQARLLTSLSEDIATLTFSLRTVPNLYVNAATVLGCLAYLIWKAPRVMIPLAGLILFSLLVHQALVKLGQKQVERCRDAYDALYQHFRGLTEGVLELKLHRGRRQAFLGELAETGDELRRGNTAAVALFTIANSWGRILLFVAIGLLCYLPAHLLQMNAAELTSYVLFLLYIRTPLQALMGNVSHVTRANVVLARIDSLGLSLTDLESNQALQKVASEPHWERLELRRVGYRYEGQDGHGFSVGPLDLVLEPGELVFLVGGNGSGKTTLSKLLIGLYSPDGGELLLDGHPVTDDNRESYRSLFSAIPSDFYLFENLLGLDISAQDERVGEYLRLLELDKKVTVKDGKFSTLALSRGQRKRLALLVAYLEDRPIYVFDEWAADQDPVFKAFFYERLLPDFKAHGKTVLAITHDDRYYGVADRILKLDSGRFVEFDGPNISQKTRASDPAPLAAGGAKWLG